MFTLPKLPSPTFSIMEYYLNISFHAALRPNSFIALSAKDFWIKSCYFDVYLYACVSKSGEPPLASSKMFRRIDVGAAIYYLELDLPPREFESTELSSLNADENLKPELPG